MDNEEGVQEQMKADLSALKDQMASISEVMLKLQKTIEDKAMATTSSTVREAEPVLQPALNPGEIETRPCLVEGIVRKLILMACLRTSLPVPPRKI